jgi:hypothetical protein
VGRTLSQFAKSMRQRAEKLPTLASNVARAGAEAVLRDWIDVMPVDTSEAISNTRVGVGSRPSGTLRPFFPGRHGSTRGASGEEALAQGLEALQNKRPGQDLYVSNTARHIGDLNRGTSAQFAGGFLPRALIVFREAAQVALKRLSE